MKSRRGFTLVELMIVVAILAIITAIAGLTLQPYKINRNLKSAAREIVSDFLSIERELSPRAGPIRLPSMSTEARHDPA